MTNFEQYRRTQIAEMAKWEDGFPMDRVSVSASDAEDGSPKIGDMIARNPNNHSFAGAICDCNETNGATLGSARVLSTGLISGLPADQS